MHELNVYLNFPGEAREAMTWYQSIFGGELTFSTFAEYDALPRGHESADKIMHAELSGPVRLYASDIVEGMFPGPFVRGDNINLSLNGDDAEQLTAWFDALAEGGTIVMPLEKQVWGDTYGAILDRYGINWMVDIAIAEGPGE